MRSGTRWAALDGRSTVETRKLAIQKARSHDRSEVRPKIQRLRFLPAASSPLN